MTNTNIDRDHALRLPTLRDLVTPVFRYKRAAFLTAMAVMACTILLVLLTPKQYESEMKFLVKRERAETIVSPDSNSVAQNPTEVTEDELNSEVEVLRGHDLLSQVASSAGLVAAGDNQAAETAKALSGLQKALRISPVRRTTLIQVAYTSPDPQRAVKVLDQLTHLYLEKHLALHRPPGAYQFFKDQAEHFRTEMEAAETQLKEYGEREQVVSADTEKDSTLRQLADFESSLQQTQAQVADANRRISDLEQQEAATPPRQTTQIRKTDNATLVSELKSRVLTLETKRADMLRKFTPSYPPVVETEGQLAQAREALERTQQSPLTEETTDQNPTHQWLRSELVRVRTERSAALARLGAIAQSVRLFREKASRLDAKATVQQDLRRSMKTAEENYLLYKKKEEEARISDALDRTRIANIVVAEPPTVPTSPSSTGRFWILAIGAVLAAIMGLAVAYLLAYISPYVQSPEDVENTLGVPVLASLSARR
jgi:uncharacterized protein involved in exopolysaccharide biosynthesis